MERVEVMRRAFVSGLWGDQHVQRRSKVKRDIANMLKREFQPEPRIAYCYGQENFDYLTRLGLSTRLADDSPVKDFLQSGNRSPNESGNVNFGVSMWRHKLEILDLALQEFDEVIWLDWDCWLHAPLPPEFWEHLNNGARLQASLRMYRRRQCRWRNSDPRKVPSAAWIYLRCRELSSQLLRTHDQYPLLREEQVMARTIDDLMGGWQGPSAWFDQGYEPFCFYVRGQLRSPLLHLFDAR